MTKQGLIFRLPSTSTNHTTLTRFLLLAVACVLLHLLGATSSALASPAKPASTKYPEYLAHNHHLEVLYDASAPSPSSGNRSAAPGLIDIPQQSDTNHDVPAQAKLTLTEATTAQQLDLQTPPRHNPSSPQAPSQAHSQVRSSSRQVTTTTSAATPTHTTHTPGFAQARLLHLHVDIPSGTSMYSYEKAEFGIATRITMDRPGSSNIRSLTTYWPKPLHQQIQIADTATQVSVYQGVVSIPMLLTLSNPEQGATLKLAVSYALCAETCSIHQGTVTAQLAPLPLSEHGSLDDTSPTPLTSTLPAQTGSSTDTPATSDQLSQPTQPINQHSNTTSSNQTTPAQQTHAHTEHHPSSYANTAFMLLMAFLGGAILNLMPCVFPVLSIKVLHLLKYSTMCRRQSRINLCATSVGIILSFIALAILTLCLKSVDRMVGWGFHFQETWYLIALVVLLLLVANHMADTFKINIAPIRALDFDTTRIRSHCLSGLLSGITISALATPCTAPLLTTAIAFALSQDKHIILLIYTVIGIGMSTPYLLLAARVDLVRLIPKPGRWMSTVKRLLLLPLVITALFLLNTLQGQLSPSHFTLLLIALTLIQCAIFALHQLGLRSQPWTMNRVLAVACLCVTLLSLPLYYHEVSTTTQQHSQPESTRTENVEQIIKWQDFDPHQLQTALAQGQTVLVNVTADWCITCKLNEKIVFGNEDVVDKLNTLGVLAMRADYTKHSQDVLNYLAQHGRYGVPTTVVYKAAGAVTVLPELLSKAALFSALQ